MAANPDDLLDFYGADLGPTRALAVVAANGVSTGGAADAAGALPPGKYLIQTTPPGGTDQVFIGAVPFKKTDTAWNAVAAAPPLHPLVRGWMEINVRKNHSDRIFARATGAASATVYVTQISQVPKKLPPA